MFEAETPYDKFCEIIERVNLLERNQEEIIKSINIHSEAVKHTQQAILEAKQELLEISRWQNHK